MKSPKNFIHFDLLPYSTRSFYNINNEYMSCSPNNRTHSTIINSFDNINIFKKSPTHLRLLDNYNIKNIEPKSHFFDENKNIFNENLITINNKNYIHPILNEENNDLTRKIDKNNKMKKNVSIDINLVNNLQDNNDIFIENFIKVTKRKVTENKINFFSSFENKMKKNTDLENNKSENTIKFENFCEN